MSKELTPVNLLPEERRKKIREAVVGGISDMFPIIGDHKELHLRNVRVAEKRFSKLDHKNALLKGGTLAETVKGDLVIKDKSGKVIDSKTGHTLMRMPYFTPMHSFVVDGNEYIFKNQLRTRPGIYTRRRGNDAVEASFNLAKGRNFRVEMDSRKGHLQLEHDATKIPLYPVLRGLGMQHSDIENKWGAELAAVNRDAFDSKRDHHISKLYGKLVPPNRRVEGASNADKLSAIQDYYGQTQIDEATTRKTLGRAYARVSPDSLATAGKKLLDVYNGRQDPDDRDSLEFQRVVTVDDLFKFRMDKSARDTARKLKSKLDLSKSNTIDRVIPTSSLTPIVKSYVTSSRLAALPTQINPLEIVDASTAVTRVGEGGIENDRAIPRDVRNLHPTHFGVIDPFRTPESSMAGVDVRTTIGAHRDSDGNLYAPLRNAKTGRMEYVSPETVIRSAIAFPHQETKKGRVDVLKGGVPGKVRPSQVDFEMDHSNDMLGHSSSLIPFLDSSQGNRLLMASKMVGQALPLYDREEPLIQVKSHRKGVFSNEESVARKIVPLAPVSGRVSRVDKEYVHIKDRSGKTHSMPYSDNFPLASKTYIHDDLKVKAGDKVERGQPLAENNYTKSGRLALGKNLEVGYMAYHGLNTNDAIVVSKSAANKMTSLHMVKKVIPLDKETHVGTRKHSANFPREFTKEQYGNIPDGVVKPGTRVKKGDPIVAALRTAPPSIENQILGRIHKSLRRPYSDASITWDKNVEGEVVDVARTGNRITVTVKSEEPLKLGDKLVGRYGNKGVVSKILPDEDMVRNEADEPLDLLWASTGVVSRINPAQILETSLAKVAKKRGAPMAVQNFNKVDNVKWVKDALKKEGLKDKETLFDPITGKKIPKIMTGPQYIYKLFKSSDTSYAARGINSGYDLNNQPARGGKSGAKGTGSMEVNALLAHDARDTLRENAIIKGTRNSEYWRSVQLGLPAPQPKSSFAYDKFTSMLSGAGVRLGRSGNDISMSPLTDKDILKMSSGEIKNGRMVRAKDLRSEKGGLFDVGSTGGMNGSKWTHVPLPEPVLNPIFKDPARRLLGLTEKQLDEELAAGGGAQLRKRLNSIDPKERIAELKRRVYSLKGAAQDNAVKQIRALESLSSNSLKAGDAYTLKNLPVMPPIYRPITPSHRGDLLVSDINHLYKDAVLARDKFKEARSLGLPDEDVKSIRKHMQATVNAVIGTSPPASRKLAAKKTKGIVNTITGTKDGFYNSKLISRRLDLTGRGVAAPDPSLGLDEVGLPEDMAWDMYSPFVVGRLVKRGYPAVQAKRYVDERAPQAREELSIETRTRPITINRAPSLHKYNLISAYPRIIPGTTIKVNPFIEDGMNLDYDGDALQMHLPATQGAVKDAEKMLLSKNIFGQKNESNLLVFPKHEAIAGLEKALIQKPSKAKTRVFKNRAEALAAYRRGEIGISDPVEIKNA